MAINPSFWRSSGKTDAAFLSVVNSAFHTNLPTALSAQTWLTSMGYYTNWISNFIIMIVTGEVYTMALKNNQVWGWGVNNYGQLGDNSTTNQCTPVSIQGSKKTFCQIKSGEAHISAIDKYGRVWGWGYNLIGQLGDNSITNQCTPVSIHGTNKTFCAVTSGYNSTLGIDNYGQVWGWGQNFSYNLGDFSQQNRCTPVSIHGEKKIFCKISAGSSHTTGIDNYGQIWGWGYNVNGQLGDNSTTNQCTPVSIQGSKKTFCSIAQGPSARYQISIDNYGQIWGWGYNVNGQLGDNSTLNSCTPVSIHGTKKTFCVVTSGYNSTLGIDNYGQVWGWGYNGYGQLGDNSITNQCTPVSIHGTKKTFCTIASGLGHSIGVDKDNKIWGWGYNLNGQLGDNSTLSQLTPVRVCNF